MSWDLESIYEWAWNIHQDDEGNSEWGTWKEILFWIVILLAHFAFIIYSAWRLAVKHTEATGSSVLVPVKEDEAYATKSGDSQLPGGAARRRNEGFSRFLPSGLRRGD